MKENVSGCFFSEHSVLLMLLNYCAISPLLSGSIEPERSRLTAQ